MKRLVTAMMTLTLVLSAIVLVAGLVSPAIASAFAPLPPDHPVSHSAARSADESAQEMLPPPSPHEASRQIQEARARSAIEEVLQKHSRHWGPRYQVEPVQVSVDGEWAHGVAQWQGEAEAMGGPIHVLARRSESGAWQALMPSAEGLYLQWVDEVPQSLARVREKNQMRKQGTEAQCLRPNCAAPAIPQVAITGPQVSEQPAEFDTSIPGVTQPTVTPTPDPRLSVATGDWLEYVDDAYGFSVSVPPYWSVFPAAKERAGSVTRFSRGEQGPGPTEETLPIQDPIVIEIGVFNRDKPPDVRIDEWAVPDPAVAHAMISLRHTGVAGYEALRQDFDDGIQSGSVFMVSHAAKVYFIAVMPLHSLDTKEVLRVLESFQIVSPYSQTQRQSRQLYPATVDGPDVAIQAPSGYRLPFVGWHTISCGPGCCDTHTGRSREAIDFGQMPEKTPIYATEAGNIVYATYGWNDGFGNLLKLEHDRNTSWYAHLDSFVRTSGWVNAEDQIAYSGNTGYSTGPHLHFEVRDSNNYSIWIRDLPGVTWYSGDPSKPCQSPGDNDGEATGPPLGATCPPPNLVSPDWGYVHPDDTVTFRWDPVDCPDQNGYLLRIGTSPDGSDVVSDRLSLGIQTNVTIGSQWHNRHLYWSVRANASGAPWSGSRRFRIELGSGGDCPLFELGDANCDGCVDDLDYVGWWKSYKKDLRADFNGDGITDDLDYVIWWKNFGTCQGG